jgi:hypothetical protein
MSDSNAHNEGFVKPPPSDIRIDREGNWYANGQLVIHEKILKLFQKSLVREGDMYLIRIGVQSNPVMVEDVPFFVRGVFLENTAEGIDVIRLMLNDGRTIGLDPNSMRSPDMHSLYAAIPGTGMEARFSREALSQFGKFLDHDTATGEYILEINGERFVLPPHD